MLAERFRARIVFFHVLDLHPLYTTVYAHELGVSVPIPPPSREEIEPEWKLSSPLCPLEKIDWEKCTEEGQAAAAIVHQAEHMQADMIVMGTHGRSGAPYAPGQRSGEGGAHGVLPCHHHQA